MLFAKGQTIIQIFEQFAPKYYAKADDKIGLQLGTLNKEVSHILIALDVTNEVVDEAIAAKVDLIIAHHAIIYRPIEHIRTDSPAGKLYEKLIKHDIAVYIAHTNLDTAEDGMNDIMAQAIQLTNLSCLEEVHTEKLNKLVVFVPEEYHDRVLQALFSAGAGWIGQYSHCSFNTEGVGTFLPRKGTEPFVGKQGSLSRQNEIRIETIVPEQIQRNVIQSMLKAHPYEEVAYDIYPMDLKGRTFGLGRVGTLPESKTLQKLVEQVKEVYDVPTARVVGDLNRSIHKVAVLGGAGGRYINHAKFSGADVLITGDIDYHTAQDALAMGLAIIDPGHNVEKIMKEPVAHFLQGKMKDKKYDTLVTPSRINTEPFIFM